MDCCKLAFLRAILCEEKKAIKNSELRHIDVPFFAELSVKNMYEDAMRDPEVSEYLPDKKMCSGKLPERAFFFGVLATKRHGYLTKVVADANSQRFKAGEGSKKKDGILLSDAWLDELTKHPYYSSKILPSLIQRNLALAFSC